nr:hypothetical protein [Tanacetum cinerariifolium]
MSAKGDTTPIVTTVTKPATNPRDANATPRVNIQDFCEEYYKDILPIIIDKVRRDKRKEVHAMLDFEEGSRERRTRERSHYSSARSLTARPERLKSKPSGTSFKDHPHGRSRLHRVDASNEGRRENREHFRGIGESYDDSHFYHDRDRSLHMKRRRDSESPLFSVSKSDSGDGRTRMPNNVKTYDRIGDLEDHVKNFQASTGGMLGNGYVVSYVQLNPNRAARVRFDELPVKSIDSYKAAFLAYFMQQQKYIKDPVEIHNIKQKDGETIEDFMERFKVETGRMKGAPKCMRIFGFMHGVNNLELTKQRIIR